MIDKNTILEVRAWFIAYLQQGWNELYFEEDLLYRKFNFYKDLINFLDEINSSQFVRCCKGLGLCNCDIWETYALNSILKEAKKLKILKKVKRDISEAYKYELIQELIEKMKTNRSYCMIICNFLANSKLSETPKKYINLCVLCQYWVNCQKTLESNFRFEYQLLGIV